MAGIEDLHGTWFPTEEKGADLQPERRPKPAIRLGGFGIEGQRTSLYRSGPEGRLWFLSIEGIATSPDTTHGVTGVQSDLKVHV